MKRIAIITGFCMLLLAGGSQQVWGEIDIDRLQFHHITDKEGLSQGTVGAILQDSYGYMWFGTRDGLNRYNGYEMTVYKNDPDDPGSLSYNEISDIFESSDSTLWIATYRNGFSRYNREKDNFEHFFSNDDHTSDTNVSHASVYEFVEDDQGNLWISTLGGLNKFDPERETFEYFFHDSDDPRSLSHNYVTTILFDSHGKLWVGTQYGLNIMDREKGTFQRYKSDSANPQSIKADYIQTLYEDSDGTVWVGTRLGGLNRYHRDTDTFSVYVHDPEDPFSISGNSVYSVMEDYRGMLWVGTENDGLNTFDRQQERFNHYKSDVNDPYSLNNNTVYSLYESDTRILWVGTFNGGVNFVDRKSSRFQHIMHDPARPRSMSNNSILSFYEDASGKLWIGTDGGGLNYLDRSTGEFHVYRHDPDDPNSLPSDIIFDITSDTSGNLWLATYRGGLSRFDRKSETFTNYQHDPNDPYSINNNFVFVIYVDPDDPGKLWVGTNGGGVNLMDTRTERFTHYEPDPDNPDAIGNGYIRYFLDDSQGNFWVGNYGGFLASFDRETEFFREYDLEDRYFQGNAVQSILEDSRGRLWLASRGGGLKRLDRETYAVTSYTTRDGLPNNNIHGILEDDNGNLWISSNNGISMFDPDEESVVNYGLVDGLQSREFNPTAYFKDREGYMYFGGVNGFNRFHPDSISQARFVPPIVLTGLMLFNQPVPIAEEGSVLNKHISMMDEIVLSHDQSVLTIEFGTLNYEVNKNDRFAYKLEGFDSDWNHVGDKRSATYTNLNPGQYTFRARATNSSGISGEDVHVGLVIVPPFWQTTWFYLLSGLLAIGLIATGYRWKVHSIHEHNRELEREVAHQTKDLKAALEQLKNTQNELVEKAHKAGMADLATNVLHNIGNILNSVNVSATMLREILSGSHIRDIHRANALLKSNRDDIENFILNNPKGVQLLDYYLKLDQPLAKEHEQLGGQVRRLSDKIQLIIDVVAAQQSYSMSGRVKQNMSVAQIVQDTITLQDNSFQNHDIEIVKELQPVDEVHVEKSKLVHVLINVLKNAKESIQERDPENRTITISTGQDSENVYLSIRDNGVGIGREEQNKIFSHGYTTKKTGHGYGLHSCANYMKEMGGGISMESEGPGKGACFTIRMPIADKQNGEASPQEAVMQDKS